VIGSSPLQGACTVSARDFNPWQAQWQTPPSTLQGSETDLTGLQDLSGLIHPAPDGAQSAVYTKRETAPGGPPTVHAYPYSAPKLNYTLQARPDRLTGIEKRCNLLLTTRIMI
jgi:hypothetical protein